MTTEFLNHSVSRRDRARFNQQRHASSPDVEPSPTHGDIPNLADGWVPDQPTQSAELFVAAIRCLHFDDGHTRRFYLMHVRAEILQAKRELVAKKLKKLRHTIRDAEKREAKRNRQRLREIFGR
jgi:hypothetical protein